MFLQEVGEFKVANITFGEIVFCYVYFRFIQDAINFSAVMQSE